MKRLYALIVGAILFFSGLACIVFNYALKHTDMGSAGPVGDLISGTIGPVINLFGALLVYISFHEQYKMNQMQNKRFDDQELKREFEEKERRFFFLIEQYNLNLNSIDFAGRKGKTAIPLFLAEYQLLLNAFLEAYQHNYELQSTSSIRPAAYFRIVRYSFGLYLEGLAQGGSERELLKSVLDNVPAPEGHSGRIDNLKDGEELHATFPEFIRLLMASREKSYINIDSYQLNLVFTTRYGHLTGYFKIIYEVLNYVNTLNSKLYNYEKKKELIQFFLNLLSPEELLFLAFAGLSEEMDGIEMQSRFHFVGPQFIPLDTEESIDWVNRMMVSKYKLFDQVYKRHGTEFHLLESVYSDLFVVYPDAGQLGDSRWDNYNWQYFGEIWRNS